MEVLIFRLFIYILRVIIVFFGICLLLRLVSIDYEKNQRQWMRDYFLLILLILCISGLLVI
jgi:hypothetical protein